jgi:L-2-hydroxyglutarate oxidase LhgO
MATALPTAGPTNSAPEAGAIAVPNDGNDAAIDVAIIGGGVVGCAIAVAAARAGKSVLVLEAAGQLGTGITSRNSGVIHSGLYYAPGSLKAQSCVRGNRLLYEWAAAHDVWHRACGKLVVAQDPAQVGALEALAANARSNRAPGVQLIDGAAAARREPAVAAAAALWCPATGIIDPHELVLSLRAAAEAAGALFVLGAEVRGIATGGDGQRLETTRGEIRAGQVVNAAGLASDRIARLAGADCPPLHPCRGDYFRLRTAAQHRHLIYPVKDPASPGLGIHLTLARDDGYRLGPDARYVDRRDDFTDAAPAQHARFLAAARQLLGPVPPEALSYESCGIRPKLRGPADPDEKDFLLLEAPAGFVHLVGIESPGLTAALDLGDRVVALLA